MYIYVPGFLLPGDFSSFLLMPNIGDCDSDSLSESKLPTETSEICMDANNFILFTIFYMSDIVM